MPRPEPRRRLLRSPALRRAISLGRRIVDLFPMTPLGLVTVTAAGFALRRYGIVRVDLLYLVIGAVGLGLAGLGLVTTVLAAIVVRRALGRVPQAAPLRLTCGVRVQTGLTLPSLWYLPLAGVRWSWTHPRGTVTPAPRWGKLEEEVRPTRRALEESLTRRVEVGDALALTRIAFLHREARAVKALPAPGALDRLVLARTVSGGEDTYDPLGTADGERLDLRAYAPGDPIRFVLWKVFARTRELVVRTPERALSPARRSVAYLVTGRGDEAAAGVARQAVETGALGTGFVLGADGVPATAESVDEALEVIARSASAEEGGAGLGSFLARVGKPGTRAIFFVPAFDGPWVDAVVAAARAHRSSGRGTVQVLVCADGLDRRRAPSPVRRIFVGGEADDAPPRAEDVARLFTALAGSGAEIRLVDRAGGRVYTPAAILPAAAPLEAEPVPASSAPVTTAEGG
jgi:hypothetical protein